MLNIACMVSKKEFKGTDVKQISKKGTCPRSSENCLNCFISPVSLKMVVKLQDPMVGVEYAMVHPNFRQHQTWFWYWMLVAGMVFPGNSWFKASAREGALPNGLQLDQDIALW